VIAARFSPMCLEQSQLLLKGGGESRRVMACLTCDPAGQDIGIPVFYQETETCLT